uniref:Secreted venom protein family 3 protein n=1 Tax=Pristhesancus plagipennis TaxID=1955184 RepID=A0A2K8JN13_PRIPG|nr:secreted venom protein family 3 protein [Pristhesancus plagipennis]
MKLQGELCFIVTITLAFLAITTVPVLANNCQGNSHNEIFGRRETGDKLVYEDHINESWKLFKYVVKDIAYPLRGQQSHTITYIEIIDNYTNGNGGCAYILEGGVGKKFVKFHMKSKFNRGIDFQVKVYGR